MVDTEKDAEKLLSPLARLLGEETEKGIKEQIGKLVIDKIKNDINDYGCYLFYPEDYSETVNEAFDSVKTKIKKMYKDAALEQAEKAVEIFKKNTENAMELNPKKLTYEQKKEFENFLYKEDYKIGKTQINRIIEKMQQIYES